MTDRSTTSKSDTATMGYQPALDGLRALSVALVILYHAGVAFAAGLPEGARAPWFFDGGFLGVEVFFVVSGYLITTLLLEERERTGRVSLRGFWVRRFRRLMPALWVMVAVTVLWTVIWGRQFVADLRWDSLFGLVYAANFQQLFDKVSYFGGEPHLLRHLWSLAVEEHFYLVFPVVFVVATRRSVWSRRRLLFGVVGCAVVSMVSVVVVWARPVERLGETGVVLDDLRQNWAYLSSFTRMGGILVGVALAVVWSPWRRRVDASPWRRRVAVSRWGRWVAGRGLDVVGVLAVLGVVLVSLWWSSDSPVLYRGGLAGVSLLSAVAIAAAVHPGSRVMRVVFGNRVMAGLGRRSYGLYLWHWPVFVGPLGGRATWVRLVVGVPVTLVLSELCLRLVETPIRRGVISRIRQRGKLVSSSAVFTVTGAVAAVTVSLLVVESRSVDDAFVDPGYLEPSGPVGSTTSVVDTSTSLPPNPSTTAASSSTSPASSVPSTVAPTTTAAAPTTLPLLPRRVLVVGDSQGLSFMNHMPDAPRRGIVFSRGALTGCGVLDEGRIISESGYDDKFTRCRGWQDKWAAAAKRVKAEVTVVMLGAWDVFSLDIGGRIVEFGTPEYDALWVEAVRSGVDALVATGSRVALLEVPCFRPTAVGNKMRLFPERGFDVRTRRLAGLLREIAAADPEHVSYVSGPAAWCSDDPIATNRAYRYDGVHVTARGAAFVADTITDALLAVPVDAGRH